MLSLRRSKPGTFESAALERSMVGLLMEVLYSAGAGPLGARISTVMALGLGARLLERPARPPVDSNATATPRSAVKRTVTFMVSYGTE